LLASTSDSVGKRLRGRIVAADIEPEFMSKRNSEPIGNGRQPDDTDRQRSGSH
jgi:hypothetical protein